ADCLFEVSRILLSDKASSMYATCFYGILHVPSGELRFASAGHNPPYLVSGNGVVNALQPKNGFPLGLYPGRYETGRVHLQPGDALFVYTDGVTEAFNAADEEFSEQRLQDVLAAAASSSCRDLISSVHARVLDFTAGAPQSDDITMMAVRRCG
ncbi:MAG TPA: PP2C family protein-serine/threonine phosphatase, partial [Candidatus Solibacter sp.]|nr:PP2C family protein-serine/threonine phosphatase [Candidatus Solibacter sp.]